ncbi:MAG: MutS family DNA mismatch repair protein, partial [Chloroflexota bacterium]
GQLALVDDLDPGAAGQEGRAADLGRMARLAGMPLPVGSPAGAIVSAVTCWDVHVLAGMERWQARHGREVRGWFADLAEADALSGLAALAFDNPSWPYPMYMEDEPAFASRALGHPLLPEDVRKANDVTVGPAGSFLLVTGSNMSGKSTLLRSIGINAVLAGAGGPVCAEGLAMPPVALWTSVRVQDSLERGVSFFMAELQRLKLVVDAADRARAGGGPPVLYLLDEILQGTNTAERQIAARRIIRHLVETGAIGAVSTHDLALGDAPELAVAAVPVHFRDEVHEGPAGMEMSFDRVLRPGIATTTNALRLMQLIGLDVE